MLIMRLFTAIVPPMEVVEEVKRVVQSVNPPINATEKRGSRPKLAARRYRGAHAAGRDPVKAEDAAPVETEPTTHELDSPDVEDMYLPLAGFGNVALGDADEAGRRAPHASGRVVTGRAGVRRRRRPWSSPATSRSGSRSMAISTR